MNEWDKLYLIEESGRLPDADLASRIRLHTEAAQGAMSQSAATGNANAVLIFEREAQARAKEASPTTKR